MPEKERAEKERKTAAAEFAALCVQLVKDHESGKLTAEQFEQGCKLLEQVAAINGKR